MACKTIMFQGTSSGVGKSLITAAFCRIFANMGLRVAPFKAQNMSLNAIVCPNGGEISIAQYLQARASRILPDVRMNPILLKPTGSKKSQVIALGKVVDTINYGEYYKRSEENFKIVLDAFESLKKEYDVIILEGAGSPAEINLEKFDIVNMRLADKLKAPVFIVSDIDRGGVFASMKGTFDLVNNRYKPLIKGFIINKFRGDITLLKPAIDMFKKIINVKIVGVVPYIDNLILEDEDSQFIKTNKKGSEKSVRIGVIKLRHMSNFTDFYPLLSIENVLLEYIDNPYNLSNHDLIIIPGTKSTVNDLLYLKKRGFFDALKNLMGKVWIMGICGGFQVMGSNIIDKSIEFNEDVKMQGLNFFDMTTKFDGDKLTSYNKYKGVNQLKGCDVVGYEIHNGKSTINNNYEQLLERKDLFIIDKKNKLIGTYLHGIFNNLDVVRFVLSLISKDVIINKD
ncbi:MAG: cobyric acid synthase, partial [Deferribacterota bacterium]|nr:cobyric acid synthase [Deferribacterota bacterium]